MNQPEVTAPAHPETALLPPREGRGLWAARVLGVAALYLATAKLGFLLAIHPGNVTAVWPPSGIAFAALLLWGNRVWPGIWLGSFLANTWVFKGAAVGLVDIVVGASIGVGSVLQPLAGVWGMRRWIAGANPLLRSADVFRFVVVTLAMCFISSTFGVSSLLAAGMTGADEFGATWLTWWLGDVTGVLVVTPLLLAWSRQDEHDSSRKEAWLLLVALVITGVLVFMPWSPLVRYPLSFLVFPGLIWAALRLNLRTVTLAIAGLGGLAIWQTVHGVGPFALGSPNESLLVLQAFVGVVTLTTLTLFAAVAERGNARDALQESEERFRTMADSAPVLIWMSGPDKLCTWFNQQWLRFTGRSMAQELGNGWADNVHPAELTSCLHTYNTAFDARQPFTMEYRLRRHDGAWRWVFDSGVPRHDPHHQFAGYIGSCTDITERKEAEAVVRGLNVGLEQRVADRTVQLEAANRELEAFSYSVSHDLRAPVRALDGFSQVAIDDFGAQLPAEGRRYLQIIRDSARRMDTLIENLLTFSRLNRQSLGKETVATASMVRDVWMELAGQRQGRQIELTMGELPPCLGDPALLRQVWHNLLANAVKYTGRRETAVITIGCEREEERNVFFVRDNGTGFDMRYVPKLFGVFQRLHREEDFPGTGVGLALVQRIIHRHGGRVWARGEPDQGATFYFTLGG